MHDRHFALTALRYIAVHPLRLYKWRPAVTAWRSRAVDDIRTARRSSTWAERRICARQGGRGIRSCRRKEAREGMEGDKGVA